MRNYLSILIVAFSSIYCFCQESYYTLNKETFIAIEDSITTIGTINVYGIKLIYEEDKVIVEDLQFDDL